MSHSSSYQTHLRSAEDQAAEQVELKKLASVVEESLEQIAKITKLPLQEVMHVIEEVDVEQLMRATHDAIKRISTATDLTTAHITSVFKEERDATIDNIVRRLREVSAAHRATM